MTLWTELQDLADTVHNYVLQSDDPEAQQLLREQLESQFEDLGIGDKRDLRKDYDLRLSQEEELPGRFFDELENNPEALLKRLTDLTGQDLALVSRAEPGAPDTELDADRVVITEESYTPGDEDEPGTWTKGRLEVTQEPGEVSVSAEFRSQSRAFKVGDNHVEWTSDMSVITRNDGIERRFDLTPEESHSLAGALAADRSLLANVPSNLLVQLHAGLERDVLTSGEYDQIIDDFKNSNSSADPETLAKYRDQLGDTVPEINKAVEVQAQVPRVIAPVSGPGSP